MAERPDRVYGLLDRLWAPSLAKAKAERADLQDMVIDGVTQMALIQSSWNKQYEERSLREFVESGGTVYVPTPDERATFMEATDAMKEWFLANVDNAEEWLGGGGQCSPPIRLPFRPVFLIRRTLRFDELARRRGARRY